MDIAHLHFLVAEGDPSLRRSLCEVLGELGAARITEVPDGHTALRCFQDEFSPPLDVAIIDLTLEGMDGLELIRSLAEMDCRTGVIIVGALHNNLLFSIETMAKACGLELLGALGKPPHAQALRELMRHYVPPTAPSACAVGPAFSFGEVGRGLQARQFEPFFQPKIALETGHVKGLEVFARWIHPEYGALGPSSFIGALTEHKRLDFLDWYMIEKSVQYCHSFQEQGMPVEISINVAPATLAHPAFIGQIGACLARHRVAPRWITFEMPESSVLTDDADFLERLVRLRMIGYGLAIDDYGTGRSNLQLLARVPFTELKIDRSFVAGASRRRALGTVLSSCLGLAKSLDRESCAVGVETRQDWDYLQSLGCTYAQGYHIARPMKADAFVGWLEEWMQFFD